MRCQTKHHFAAVVNNMVPVHFSTPVELRVCDVVCEACIKRCIRNAEVPSNSNNAGGFSQTEAFVLAL